MKLLAVLTAAALIICPSLRGEDLPTGDENTITKTRFIDLDGDGLDDNLRDLNNDGIPEFDRGSVDTPPTPGTPATVINLDEVLGAAVPGLSLALSKSDAFAGHQFCVRGLCTSRGGFGSEDSFGLASQLGMTATGGQCAGGVCRF